MVHSARTVTHGGPTLPLLILDVALVHRARTVTLGNIRQYMTKAWVTYTKARTRLQLGPVWGEAFVVDVVVIVVVEEDPC